MTVVIGELSAPNKTPAPQIEYSTIPLSPSSSSSLHHRYFLLLLLLHVLLNGANCRMQQGQRRRR